MAGLMRVKCIIMEGILDALGLGSLVSNFQTQSVEPSTVEFLTGDDWGALGVRCIGDRVRIRQACRQTATSVTARVSERQASRRPSSRQVPTKLSKCTRRVHLGWKLKVLPSKTFIQQTLAFGGGTHKVDMGKTLLLDDTIQEVQELFFPNGRAPIQQLQLRNAVHVYLATFQGRQLVADEFPLGTYFQNHSNPVRLYLHTVFSSEISGAAICPTPGTSQRSSEISGAAMCPTPGTSQRLYYDAGTPTVQFRCALPTESPSYDLPTMSADISIEGSSCIQQEAFVYAEEIIRNLQMQLVDGDANIINVSRSSVGAERGFKKPTFNPQAKLNVRFVGERGLDAGGPTREFLCLVMKEIRDSRIFHGDSSKFLVSNISAERDGLYHTYGKMLAYSLCHNGPAPSFLTDMFTLLVLGLEDYTPTLDDVDPYVRAIVERIRTATTADEFSSAAVDIETVMIYIGGAHLLSFNKRNELVDSITNHAIKRLLKSAYEQFVDGLSTLGVLEAIRASPAALKPLFTVHTVDQAAEAVLAQTSVEFSPEGSNRRLAEEDMYSIWLDYLEHIEGKGEMGALLSFITGLNEIPPLGFDPPVQITFIHPDAVSNEHDLGVPFADTCANALRLPVGSSYTQFREVMDKILFDIGNIFANE